MKRYFNILLFVSFIFLFIYLLKQKYIIPNIENYLNLILSFLLLFAGFIASSFSWYVALHTHNVRVSFKDALISHGQSIFAKYIPGKIWVILGRAGYISESKQQMKDYSVISFKEQIIYLWAGFLISSIPTVIFYKTQWISLVMLGIIICLTIFLFSMRINHLVLKFIGKIFKHKTEIPVIRFKESIPMILSVSLIWLLWTGAFYLFMTAFSKEIIPIMMFAFPLSVCFGLVAIIVPGGIGVREGIIIGYLTLASLDIETSSTISFLNRLWFIGGEVFIFLFAVLWRIRQNRSV